MPLGPGGRSTLLVLSQVYPPDPASVGQHMADVAFDDGAPAGTAPSS